MNIKSLFSNVTTKKRGWCCVDGVVNEFKVVPKFIFTFGTGISGLLKPLTGLMVDGHFVMTNVEFYLLLITFFSMVIIENKHTMFFLRNFRVVFGDFVYLVKRNILSALPQFMDVVGFTFLLIPTMNLLNNMLDNHIITLDDIILMGKGLFFAFISYWLKVFLKNKII